MMHLPTLVLVLVAHFSGIISGVYQRKSVQIEGLQIANGVAKVICPDHKKQCLDGYTCCKLANAKYGCCPFPKAVCCSDGVHCCPNGQECQPGGFCKRKSLEIQGSQIANSVAKVICPDHKKQCLDGYTCCKLANAKYGCCPFPKAVCCVDGVHCCPNGQECQPGGFCKRKSLQIQGSQIAIGVTKVTCPDHKKQCLDGYTCCKLANAKYGCCPFPKAVCCADGVHCCPNGQECQPGGFCKRKFLQIQGSQIANGVAKEQKHSRHPKFEAFRLNNVNMKSLSPLNRLLLSILRQDITVCGDGVKRCEQYQTCCPTWRGYTCCPFTNAVCCQNSCCPAGTTCSASGVCQSHVPSDEKIRFMP